jgi:hypothetical protein
VASRDRGDHGSLNISYLHVKNRWYFMFNMIFIDCSWLEVFCLYIGSYFFMNGSFAFLIWISGSEVIDGDPIVEEGDKIVTSLQKLFFFVMQVSDTIGFGVLSPRGSGSNWIVVLISMVSYFF